jgi:hypothetical protein
MSLCVDFDLLERAVGRDGPVLKGDDMSSIVEWAASPLAKRCMVHASLVEEARSFVCWFRTGYPCPAGHVSSSSLVVLLHSVWPDGEPSDVLTHSSFNPPEMALLEINPAMLLFEANGFKLGKPVTIEASGALCGLTDLLQRIRH